MANKSTVVANALLQFQVGKTPGWSTPSSVYLQWDTTAYSMPAGTGGVAVTTGQVTGIARVSIPPASWGTAAGGVISNSAQVLGLLSTGGTGATVVAASLWDAATGGQILESIPIASFLYSPSVQPIVNVGALTLSLT
jgi:hypothetical protein